MTHAYDAIIIGTGQAGPPLAGRLAAAGMKVAVIERRLFGGTCVNTGCIPTKTMVASAYAAHMARRAAEYGVDIAGAGQRGHEAGEGAKGRSLRAKSERRGNRGCKSMENCTVYEGHARFESPHEVSVGDDAAHARSASSSTWAARAVVPDMPGLDEISYLTNSSMMAVDFLPRASDDRGRQLHRPGIRPDVPAIRQRGDDHRNGAAA